MTERQALLIGVPTYMYLRDRSIPAASSDVRELAAALAANGLQVEPIYGDPLQTIASELRKKLRNACLNAPKDSTLLLYFSGHGVRWSGRTWLVAHDADFSDPSELQHALVSTDISRWAARSKARLIVLIVDACREGVDASLIGDKTIGLATREEHDTNGEKKSFVIYTCRDGELSAFVPGAEGFSLATRALVRALDPERRRSTLGGWLEAARPILEELCAEQGRPAQHFHVGGEFAIGDLDLDLPLFESTGAAASSERRWIDAVASSPLWGDSPVLKDSVTRLVELAWKHRQTFARSDPWRDEEYPVRVVEHLATLVPADATLAPAELALLLAAPFVYEAVYSSGHAAIPADRLESARRSQPQLVRKAERLLEQGAREDHDAVLAWIEHRALSRSPELWERAPHGTIDPAAFEWLIKFASPKDPVIGGLFDADRLFELSRAIGASPSWVRRRYDALPLTIGRGRAEQLVYPRRVACLLALAGAMALDPRHLPDVVVDHLGLADPLTPEAMIAALRAASWQKSGLGRALFVEATHPAIDLALNDLVAKAGVILDELHTFAGEGGAEKPALAGLPSRLSADRVSPAIIDKTPAYRTPHLRFQLANEEIRELLMDERLYGSPSLAFREMYQNALDACRYREARLLYLERTNQLPRSTWSGRITFTQGVDQRGRAFVECEDNGVGMGERELAECFAKAGRRFHDLPEFLEEQSAWMRVEPPVRLWPNSQFGIGVLSYFMLADEIEVDTCRLTLAGGPGERFRVRISGSGSVFRLQSLGPGVDAGTRVRVYLNREGVSCLSTLSEQLWVAEFETTARDQTRSITWRPGVLRHPKLAAKDIVATENADFWWARDQGSLLADGIVTGGGPDFAVLNLRRARRPLLSVDRKHAIDWDRSFLETVAREQEQHARSLPLLDLRWLWDLTERAPAAAQALVKHLIDTDARVTLDSGRLEIRRAGCLPQDLAHGSLPPRLASARMAVLRGNRPADYAWWTPLPIHSLLLSSGVYGSQGVPLIHVVWAARRAAEPISVALAAARELSELGVHFVSLEESALLSSLDDVDLRLLSNELSGAPPWIKIATSLHLARASFVLGVPAADLAQRLERLASLGIELGTWDRANLSSIVIRGEDLPLLDDRPIALKIIAASLAQKKKPLEIVRRLRALEPLGIKVPSFDENTLAAIEPSPTDLFLPFANTSAHNLAKAAADAGTTIARVIDRLRVLEALGAPQVQVDAALLDSPELDRIDAELIAEPFSIRSAILAGAEHGLDVDAVRARLARLGKTIDAPSLPLDADDLALLKLGRYRREEYEVTTQELIQASLQMLYPPAAIFDRIQRLEPFGLRPPKLDPSRIRSLVLDGADRMLLELQPWNASAIVHAAERLNKSPKLIVSRMRELSGLGLDAPAIDPDSLAGFTVSAADRALLSIDFEGEVPLPSNLLSPADIARAAIHFGQPPATIVTWLEPLQRLGLDLPMFDRPTLPGLTIDALDVALLEDVRQSAGSIVAAALRLGVPPWEIISRWNRLAPLGVARFEAQLSKVVAEERDLILLSAERNGQRPWINGVVEAGHIVATAVQLAISPRAVVDRLRIYGSELPKIDEAALDTLEVDALDVRLLAYKLDPAKFWMSRFDARDIAYASVHLPMKPIEVVARLRRLAALGITAPEDHPGLAALELTAADLDLFDSSAVTLGHLASLAKKLGSSLADARAHYERFVPIGVKLPLATEDGTLDDEDLRLLSVANNGQPPWTSHEIGAQSLISKARELNKPIAEVAQTYARLQKLGGPKLQLDATTIPPDFTVDELDIKILSKSTYNATTQLFTAFELNLTIEELVRRLQHLAPLGITSKLPADLKVEPLDRRLLSKKLDGTEPLTWIDEQHIARAVETLKLSREEIITRLDRLAPALDIGGMQWIKRAEAAKVAEPPPEPEPEPEKKGWLKKIFGD